MTDHGPLPAHEDDWYALPVLATPDCPPCPPWPHGCGEGYRIIKEQGPRPGDMGEAQRRHREGCPQARREWAAAWN